jgi:hypothetical protein
VPPSCSDLLAAGFLRVAVFFRVVAFLAAGFLRVAVFFRVVAFLAAGFLRVAVFFRVVAFLAAGFRRVAVFFRVVAFLAAGFRRGAVFLRAAVFFRVVAFLAAGFLRVAVCFRVVAFLAAGFLRPAGLRTAIVFFRATVFLRVALLVRAAALLLLAGIAITFLIVASAHSYHRGAVRCLELGKDRGFTLWVSRPRAGNVLVEEAMPGQVFRQVFEPDRPHKSLYGLGRRPKTRALVTGLKAVRASDMPSKPVWGRELPGGFDSRPPLFSEPRAYDHAAHGLGRLDGGPCSDR